MVNKKGYLKTLEAVLAIVIILLFTFSVTPKPEADLSVPQNIKTTQGFILSEIENNNTLRSYIVNSDDSDVAYNLAYRNVDSLINLNMPGGYGYTFGICDMSSCISNITSLALETSIYSQDILIATDGIKQNPKVVRLWMWRQI
ncbi:MAG: hypothetical protein KKA65_05160 [Nanoarchaeota archaeon]|nr:hypothetical protein [Nanoarchaeota archaeon]MBU4456863.1 hypothetical protein [Nanoarchaeota archaeon]MCG2719899.1 hypothetical protein [Nanoarchaeota archaeon]